MGRLRPSRTRYPIEKMIKVLWEEISLNINVDVFHHQHTPVEKKDSIKASQLINALFISLELDTCAIELISHASFNCKGRLNTGVNTLPSEMSPADVEEPTVAAAAIDLHVAFSILASFRPIFWFFQLGTRPFLTCVYENILHIDGWSPPPKLLANLTPEARLKKTGHRLN